MRRLMSKSGLLITIIVTASFNAYADLRPTNINDLSNELKAARAAISGYPDQFMFKDGRTARVIWKIDCAKAQTTVCFVHASTNDLKQAIAIRAEEKNSEFVGISLEYEKDPLTR